MASAAKMLDTLVQRSNADPALVQRSNADPALVDDVVMGCVSQIGEQSNNVARMAVLASSLPQSVPGTSIDRQCGSSQQAVHFAAQAVMSGAMDVVIAAGVESMSRVPMFSPHTLAQQAGMGHYQSPAINRRYHDVQFSQFMGAQMLADKYALTRDELDAYALQSHHRAAAAATAGHFLAEIVPVAVRDAAGQDSTTLHSADEGVRADATLAGIQSVKLLQSGGVISAANASQICDGASGVVVVNERGLKKIGAPPLARITQMTVLGHDPIVMLEAPLPATTLALKRASLRLDEIDLFEPRFSIRNSRRVIYGELDG